MFTREETILRRDVPAIQIPDGNVVMLRGDTQIIITQQLGSSFTVMSDFGALYRIDAEHADALGKEPASRGAAGHGSDETLEQRVWGVMRQCYDPEIPVNIVDLGLVYNCEIEEIEPGRNRVDIKMTLTAPGCGMGPVLAQDVKRGVEALDGIAEAEVEVVFDPPWNQNMMSEAAKLQLGFL